ncbi:efflux RND transporter permease subunit [Murimonas intestini]|uniref:Membrane transport protein MMPL domain-containing protein n=1 Tax=Murimonas intestini TaxID=1337051 RepID=A0AB73T743_9FIRM|nr:MMPL family transporter [Murimonas intestini]MCR1841370.1 MMPL family transporter [Murimonas intestini]MCR1866288.1 MMPL family transporter [Murimonas intestini]MCR1882595.1 MMPL family transporter [Murimonas intestini]
MIKAGKKIVKYKIPIFILSLLLLVPAVFGYISTRVNYDIMTYLPDSLETVRGQDIMLDEFGMGAFSMVIVEDMEPKDVVKLKDEIREINHVKDVLWYDSVMDISVPVEMLPDDIKDAFFQGDATMMIALFDDTTSSDETMEAVSQMRTLAREQCYISGMSGVVTDVKDLFLQEMPIYVLIAALLSLLVLMLTMDSVLAPVLFLFSIGIAIIYNMGTNMFLGEISYITQALTAVLQLGVTMDYSIFLLNSYEENKVRFDGDKNRAMAHAISNTFKSVAGSSVTTIAGFIALCFMSFTLGMNIGVVMAKGVVIGVICCVTLLPSMILIFDRGIEKTRHKALIPNLDKISGFISKHYKIWMAVFIILLVPALYGNTHTDVYYNIDSTLPADLDSSKANAKLGDEFHMNNVYMVMLPNGMDAKDKDNMLRQIKEVDGINWAIGMDSLVGPGIPDDMIPEDIKGMLKSDNYELQFICSDYKTATDEVNNQIAQVNGIIKNYEQGAMVIGEAPLTKDLVTVTDVDFRNVNIISIAAIFVIIMIVFKSISLPVILVAVIEFAICINMAISCFAGTKLPFIASIVIGTIQLGATVDYAILMTSRYQRERSRGAGKKDAIRTAHKSSMKSIIISGCSFFAATFGVGMYSKIDIISSICNLLSRGAIISTVVVICVLPAMFMIFDKVICKTSIGFLPKQNKNKQEELR